MTKTSAVTHEITIEVRNLNTGRTTGTSVGLPHHTLSDILATVKQLIRDSDLPEGRARPRRRSVRQ